jgi:hypothetical protein
MIGALRQHQQHAWNKIIKKSGTNHESVYHYSHRGSIGNGRMFLFIFKLLLIMYCSIHFLWQLCLDYLLSQLQCHLIFILFLIIFVSQRSCSMYYIMYLLPNMVRVRPNQFNMVIKSYWCNKHYIFFLNCWVIKLWLEFFNSRLHCVNFILCNYYCSILIDLFSFN